jgi:hypothetical protein
MSAFTLEKPRQLGTRKRGIGSTDFNGQTVLTISMPKPCGQPFSDFQHENWKKVGRKDF